MLLEARDTWSTVPPPVRTKADDWATVLFCWWATSFSAVIILTRLCGRKVRSDRLFREDWIMLASLIPLFIRAIFIHFVLIYGTNNVRTVGVDFTATQLQQRAIGSRLVLAARIFYAMFIWLCKLTVSEFLKRITIRIWRRSFELTLQGIRIFLLLSFIAVVISTLAECHPFDHYWQVVPDPGAQCRQGYGFMLTMSVCDIISDILLVAFPIPVVLRSGQNWKRKLQMGSLFSLSLIMVAVTVTRVPMVIDRLGAQQYRSVWASCEILASTFVSNAVVLGSFLRDKGTKKNKYRSQSVSDSMDRAPTRRPTLRSIHMHGSEEDLFRGLGYRIPEHLRDEQDDSPRLAPPAPPASSSKGASSKQSRGVMVSAEAKTTDGKSDSSSDSQRGILTHAAPEPTSHRSMSFFDVGNLLENERRPGSSPTTSPDTSIFRLTSEHDFSPAEASRRQGPLTFLQDIGGILSVHRHVDGHPPPRSRPDSPGPAPIGVIGPRLTRHETQTSLQDAGGLLNASLAEMLQASAAASSSAARSRSRGARQSRSRRHDGSIELADVGGLLAQDHQMDASAAGLHRAQQGSAPGAPDASP